ncbi:2'-deoxycytidine 5'-triphosphate deaminase [Patescibacteria group bacterium]|nr:2'-deoxycytidine 5'-triphosphate deaminase [Patescibacteria group bacterium]
MNTGALPRQEIYKLLTEGRLPGAEAKHIQPASLDLTLSDEIYRMRGTFLPRVGERVRELVKYGSVEKIDLKQPLERGVAYLCRLNEALVLPTNIHGSANNKSSSGRVNLWTRLLVDGAPSFDQVPAGYAGELWVEIIPKSFPVKLAAGERLNQLRLSNGDGLLRGDALMQAHLKDHFLCDDAGRLVVSNHHIERHGITMTVDLTTTDIVGYRCHPSSGRILTYGNYEHIIEDFFEPIARPKNGELVLRRDEFYILVTHEGVRVPPGFAVEMAPYDVGKGEFRSHYAGFFDPGFGYGSDGATRGTPAVLEVLTHDTDFIIRDGQPICTMLYEVLTSPTDLLYGDATLGSHYANQRGPRLSKHFIQ